MIIKLVAYDDEFAEDQDRARIEFRSDEVGLPEVIEVIEDFLQACGWVFPDGTCLGYEDTDE